MNVPYYIVRLFWHLERLLTRPVRDGGGKMNLKASVSVLLSFLLVAFPAHTVTFSDFTGVNGITAGTYLERMGVSMVRFDISWRDIERIPGVYDWAVTDKKMQLLRQAGFAVLPMLAYVPVWNRRIAGSTGSPPVDYDAWLRFVRAAVNRYGSPPWEVAYFQVWNEPTRNASFWQGNHDEFFYRIYIPAAKIIRAKGKKVVFGGWPASDAISDFDRLLSSTGAIHYTDILDFHYGGEARYNRLYDRYIRTGQASGIWQTEVGYITEPLGLLHVWLRNLQWCLAHQWRRAEQYKIFWYPAWESQKPRFHGLTTTTRRQITLTDKGRQLTLLNRLYGEGDLAEVVMTSNISPRPKEKQYVFATATGSRKIIVAASLSSICPNTRCEFTIKSQRRPKEVFLVVPGFAPREITFKQTRAGIEIVVAEKEIAAQVPVAQRIFFISISLS